MSEVFNSNNNIINNNIINNNLNESCKFNVSIIWIDKKNIYSLIQIPIYFNLENYLDDINNINIKNKCFLSKIFLIFDEYSLNIAIDLSPIYNNENDKIPLLIYNRIYFWSMYFLFEKSMIKKEKINLKVNKNTIDFIENCNNSNNILMFTSIYSNCFNNNNNNNNNTNESIYNENLSLDIFKNNLTRSYSNKKKKNLCTEKKKINEFNKYEEKLNNDLNWYKLKINFVNIENEYKNDIKNNFNHINEEKLINHKKYNLINLMDYENTNENVDYLRIKITKHTNLNELIMKNKKNMLMLKMTKENNENINNIKNMKQINEKQMFNIKKKKKHMIDFIDQNKKKQKKNINNIIHIKNLNINNKQEKEKENLHLNEENNLHLNKENNLHLDKKNNLHLNLNLDELKSQRKNIKCSQNYKNHKNNKKNKIYAKEINSYVGIKNEFNTKIETEKIKKINLKKNNTYFFRSLKSNDNYETNLDKINKNKINIEKQCINKVKSNNNIDNFKDKNYLHFEVKKNKDNSIQDNINLNDTYEYINEKIIKKILYTKKNLNNEKNITRIESFSTTKFFIYINDENENENENNKNENDNNLNENDNNENENDNNENDNNKNDEILLKNENYKNDIYLYILALDDTLSKSEKKMKEEINDENDLNELFSNYMLNENNMDILFIENLKNIINEKKEKKESIIFVANKKDIKKKKIIKEGQIICIIFNENMKYYDKIKVLNKEIVFNILIYFMKNDKKLNLLDISYCPDLFWNIALYFQKNIFDINFFLMNIFYFLNESKYINEINLNYNNDIYNLIDNNTTIQNDTDILNIENEMRIMKMKDEVKFLENFLININSNKLKIIKETNIMVDKICEKSRYINKMNKDEIINFVVDKKNEINRIPLILLKEKLRNYIYEENLKMNMFACIKVIFDNVKGRCIYADSDIQKFDFIFEYIGELLTYNEAKQREDQYNNQNKIGCYMFYFKSDNKKYCIDSTKENIEAVIFNKNKKEHLTSFARLVNHSKKNANLIPKILKVSGLPRLFFIASRNIRKGEELLIDYGERNKEVIKNNKWLKL